MLPPANQTWAHSVVSQALLTKALADPCLTAIETDILMGTITTDDNDNGENRIAITAHPPETVSDLSVQSLLEQVKDLPYHLKLDFKEATALKPTVRLIQEILFRQYKSNSSGSNDNPSIPSRALFLNADILPGPGRSQEDLTVTALTFLQDCATLLDDETRNQENNMTIAYSLGWKVDVCCPFGYSVQHVREMNQVISGHFQQHDVPIVLAVNARLLAKSSSQPFLDFLSQSQQQHAQQPTAAAAASNRQLLVWTGAGEPPIGEYTLRRIQRLYASASNQVGFDVQLAPNAMTARMYDLIMLFLGYKNLLLRWIARLISSSRTKNKKKVS